MKILALVSWLATLLVYMAMAAMIAVFGCEGGGKESAREPAKETAAEREKGRNIAEDFTDPAFRKYVYELVRKAEGEPIYASDVSGETDISASSRKIKSLAGIEHFTALEKLYLHDYNELTTVDISKNTKLTDLNIRRNKLTALDVSKNLALNTLSVEDNLLTSIDVSNNHALQDLNVSNNELTNIDVSNNPKLYRLNAAHNELTAIDVSKNPELRDLIVGGNELTAIDVSGNPELRLLDARGNELANIDVSSNPALWELDVSGNELTAINLSKNPKLFYLNVACNNMPGKSAVTGLREIWDEDENRFHPQSDTACRSPAGFTDERGGREWPSTEPVAASRAPAFTDPRDGQSYRAVKIGLLTWMAQNLNYKTENSRCYNNSASYCKKYGRLYSWNDAMKACPAGWHLPTAKEWNYLANATRGDLKSKSGWNDNGNGADKYGFSALPGGWGNLNDDSNDVFGDAGSHGNWRIADKYEEEPTAWYRQMSGDSQGVSRKYSYASSLYSVRCVKDY